MAFKPAADIYSLEMAREIIKGKAFAGGTVPNPTTFNGDVTVNANLFVNGDTELNGALKVLGQMYLDELSVANVRIGNFRISQNTSGELVIEENVAGTWTERGAFGDVV